MLITWLTFDDTIQSQVEWGTDFASLDRVTMAICDYFVDGGTEKIRRYTHRASLAGIKPGVRYCACMEFS